MTPAIVSAIAGTLGLIGLLALIAYFFYSYQVRRLQQSVRRTIEGESSGLFNAEKVVDILRTFETPESRLAALKQLIGVDDRAAKRVYSKIEGSVDLGKWTDQDPKKRARRSLLIALFFVLIALIGLAYSAINSKPPIQTPHADNTIRLEHELATERDNLEFHRKIWLQELDAYRPVAQIAGKIAAHNKDDTHTLNNLIADFNAAY